MAVTEINGHWITKRISTDHFAWFGLILLLSGCTSPVPQTIREPAPAQPNLTQVQRHPAQYLGRAVRWGGTILSVENREDETEIEIVARELDSDGQPLAYSASQGRFLARTDRFLDPAVFKKDREITVRGAIEDTIIRSIGQHPYRYPIVRLGSYYLWEPPLRVAPCWYCDPFWYDPWYYPYWYPWRYHPWLWY